MITQEDIIDVLDKQLLEGMGVLLTEEEQQKCEASVCIMLIQGVIVGYFVAADVLQYFVDLVFYPCITGIP